VLTRRQKAAVIVRLLLAEGATLGLDGLDETLQDDLMQAMAAMRYVSRDTLNGVVREFLEELEGIGVVFPGGIDGVRRLLEGHLGDPAAARLQLAGSADPWTRLAALEDDELLALVDGESTVVAAVVLSKLATAKAAALLEKMEGERARDVALAVAATAAVAPDTVARIGTTLAARLDARPPRAFRDDPVARVGAMLNVTPAATRDALLSRMEGADAAFTEKVRRTIFTFADIPDRVEPRDVPKIVRGVENQVLVTALAAAGSVAPDSAEFLLANMSQRLAAQVRDEIAERGPVKTRDGESAMAAVVQSVRTLEAAGDITLITGEDDDA
jgi:flagellar motor switch protein FliG